MLPCDVLRTRANHVRLLRDSVQVLGALLAGVSQETATTRRDPHDGAKGWTVVEVVCHLRDYDQIFFERARLMLVEEYPPLPYYDHEWLAGERRYNEQDLRQVYAELQESRCRFAEFFAALTEAQWARAGVHPERGRFTMDDAVMQVGLHDVLHMEQIGRILRG